MAEPSTTSPGSTDLTVAQVLSWQTTTLTALATRWSAQARGLTTFDDSAYRAVDSSIDFWRGAAGDAMRAGHETRRTATKTLITALTDGAAAAGAGATELDAARTAVERAVRTAEANGNQVADDGTVSLSTSTHQTLLAQLPDAASYAVAAGALQVDANSSTTAVKQALTDAGTAATAVATSIEQAFAGLAESETLISPAPQNIDGREIWDTTSDPQGRAILQRYLTGGGDWYINSDPEWSEYMMSNQLLRSQLEEPVTTAAQAALQGYLANGNPSQAGTPQSLHAEIENGEAIIGYQYLHGTDSTVGDFTFLPNSTVKPRGDGTYEVTMHNSYTWNDIIDPNPQYGSDQTKSAIAEAITLGTADPYNIHINWTGSTTLIMDASGNVLSQSGYPK
ncbi:hypothetical protein ACFXK0_21840 [Nocardia sp. NPDC059177]|uniref:hypothetical protein n=1 Tax=Nocardia sp. NPDC059177 TaxID=3346759 RepID=UPI0036B7D6BB